jgi:hypothetical protein
LTPYLVNPTAKYINTINPPINARSLGDAENTLGLLKISRIVVITLSVIISENVR